MTSLLPDSVGAAHPGALAGSFLVTVRPLIGIIAAIGGVQTVLKARVGESDDRVEPPPAGAVPRRRCLGAHIAVAVSGPTLGLIAAGIVIALMAGTAGLGVGVGDVLLQALTTIPAIWTVRSVSGALVGARPQVKVAA